MAENSKENKPTKKNTDETTVTETTVQKSERSEQVLSDNSKKDISDNSEKVTSDKSKKDTSDTSKKDASDKSKKDTSDNSKKDASDKSKKDTSENSKKDISDNSKNDNVIPTANDSNLTSGDKQPSLKSIKEQAIKYNHIVFTYSDGFICHAVSRSKADIKHNAWLNRK